MSDVEFSGSLKLEHCLLSALQKKEKHNEETGCMLFHFTITVNIFYNLSGATSGLWLELQGWEKDEGVERCLGGDTQSQKIIIGCDRQKERRSQAALQALAGQLAGG